MNSPAFSSSGRTRTVYFPGSQARRNAFATRSPTYRQEAGPWSLMTRGGDGRARSIHIAQSPTVTLRTNGSDLYLYSECALAREAAGSSPRPKQIRWRRPRRCHRVSRNGGPFAPMVRGRWQRAIRGPWRFANPRASPRRSPTVTFPRTPPDKSKLPRWTSRRRSDFLNLMSCRAQSAATPTKL